ncbi:probable carbohydrate esterase At4g34215 [Olea europaea var. sylvestris]|uniref:probable carbohydrate esterase At4g34215 n=1 Tax=Olea europaea var. sylvestris TaxID=158386 RepID=UPI000C1D837E|nr:probable carbohydrate esterase At4g34215 [Olea europaea var. sylvestris]
MFAFTTLMILAHCCGFISCVFLFQQSPHAFEHKDIFILAGQSNMAGRGGVKNRNWDHIIPPECSSKPTILRLTATLMWEEAHEPLHEDMDPNKTCGVGPGLAFANSLLGRNPSIGVIGLVPCAFGGSSIEQWKRGSKLYNRLIKRAEAALLDGGQIRALLWYQGENDTINKSDAELYKMRSEEFFIDIRTDLASPTLPIVQVALASALGPYIDIVRKAQLGIDLPNVTCVDAKGLELMEDGVHLKTSAQVCLGKMLADAFLCLRLV